MSKKLTLADLKSIDFEEQELVKDKSQYRNYSKRNALIIGYLLGVNDKFLETIPNEPTEYHELKKIITKNDFAVIIHHLNNMRSNLLLNFKEVSRTIRVASTEFKPLYKIKTFEEDYNELKKMNIDITTGRSDIMEYLKRINDEINKKIDNIKTLFPDWIDFKHIRAAFIMPPNFEYEKNKFQNNQNFYPYKRYFNWREPIESGNILLSDNKILNVFYESNYAIFTEQDRVIDVSEKVKININDFIETGKKVQIFIDGENSDPYHFAAAIDSLSDEEIEKIEKITVYYDEKYSTRAWTLLQYFVCNINVETVAVKRLLEKKSLVDPMVVAGASKAVYQDKVDSIILCSSDSDFWSLIETVPAKYLVMVETEKCGNDFKDILRQHNIFYCYLDRFKTPTDNQFFKMVIRNELQKQIDNTLNSLNIDVNYLLSKAIEESRASISDQERENVFNKFVKGLQVDISKDGTISLKVPE